MLAAVSGGLFSKRIFKTCRNKTRGGQVCISGLRSCVQAVPLISDSYPRLGQWAARWMKMPLRHLCGLLGFAQHNPGTKPIAQTIVLGPPSESGIEPLQVSGVGSRIWERGAPGRLRRRCWVLKTAWHNATRFAISTTTTTATNTTTTTTTITTTTTTTSSILLLVFFHREASY